MYEAGIVLRYVDTVIDAVERTGTNLGMKPLAVIKAITFAASENSTQRLTEILCTHTKTLATMREAET